QRALLAVQELRKRPVLRFATQRDPLLGAPLLERRAAQVVDARHEPAIRQHIAEYHLLLVDVGVPWHIGVAVPLAVARLFVQLAQLRAGVFTVVPAKDRILVLRHGMDRLGRIGSGDGKDGLQIIHLRTAYEVVIFRRGKGSLVGHVSSWERARQYHGLLGSGAARQGGATHSTTSFDPRIPDTPARAIREPSQIHTAEYGRRNPVLFAGVRPVGCHSLWNGLSG